MSDQQQTNLPALVTQTDLSVLTATMTDKQIRFCNEYMLDCNATQAAIRAGYSFDSARQMGSENLSKPYIRAYINARLSEIAISKEETVKLISDIAQSSLNDYFI